MSAFVLRVKSFWFGLTLPLRALRFILSHPALITWSIIPTTLTLSLYYFVIKNLQGVSHHWLESILANWTNSGPTIWSTFLEWILNLLFILVGALTFSIVASVVASPFNDFLAESAEKYTSLSLPLKTTWGRKLRIVTIDVMKTLAAAIATLIALLLSWVPLVNLVAWVLALLLLTFQFVSYPQTRRAIGVKGGVAFLFRHFFVCLGFGIAFSFLFALPLISSLCLPLAVVGGTLLFAASPQLK